ASRAVGLDWRTSAALGILMNTRGLMELIVLNVGLSLKIISPELFAMMVLMALATTLATAPILSRLTPAERPSRS
ncbi:MAG TPA: cation:proton antiporter, partial [Planctomycetaceae bacterium]|nr:cation:proton antiporter [Planctomycetaceae bacterium]